jgi:uncharacterized membrane protein YgcG
MSDKAPGASQAAATANPPSGETDLEKLRRELSELKADLLKQAPANKVEEELRKELADLRAATSTTSAPVAEHLAREALYKREPYKATLDRQRAKLAGYAAGLADDNPSRDTLHKEFALAARGGALSAQDAVLLHGLLAPTPFRFKLAKAILINTAPATRAALFNTLVLGEAPATFEDAYGEVVSQMPWPLFPVRPDFAELNADLLREATAILEGASGVKGAGPTLRKRTPRVFGNPDREATAHLVEMVRGAGYAPVADGRADLSEVEAAFNFMAGEIADLRAQIANLKSNGAGGRGGNRGRGNSRGRGNRGGRGNNGGGGYNNGGYNGYSRVRGGGAEDDDPEEGNHEGGSH